MKRSTAAAIREKVGIVIGTVIIAATVLTALCLPLASRRPFVAVGVWVALVLAYRVKRAALAIAGYASSQIECIPCILIVQYQLDRIMPLLGSSLILFGYLALLTECVRGSWFPYARARQCMPARRRAAPTP